MLYLINNIKIMSDYNFPLTITMIAIILLLICIILFAIVYALFYHTAIFVIIIGGAGILLYASYCIVKIIRML